MTQYLEMLILVKWIDTCMDYQSNWLYKINKSINFLSKSLSHWHIDKNVTVTKKIFLKQTLFLKRW